MVDEVVELLRARHLVVDLTVGAGGHAEALLRSGVERVVGLDRDPDAVGIARERLAPFAERARVVEGRFSELDVLPALEGVDGVLYDLGLSSMQLDRAERGFSYRKDAPLDMRMGGEGPTAADLVNTLSERDLADLIYRFRLPLSEAILLGFLAMMPLTNVTAIDNDNSMWIYFQNLLQPIQSRFAVINTLLKIHIQ